MSNTFFDEIDVQIQAGANITSPIDLRQAIAASGNVIQAGMTPFAIVIPAAWVAANLTFQMSPDNGVTFYNMYDAAGNEYVVTGTVGAFVVLDPYAFSSGSMLKIRSGTNGSPVTQTAAVTLKLILRRA